MIDLQTKYGITQICILWVILLILQVLGTKQIATVTDIKESQLELTDEKGTHLAPYFLVDGFLDRYLESFAEELIHFVKVVQGRIQKSK